MTFLDRVVQPVSGLVDQGAELTTGVRPGLKQLADVGVAVLELLGDLLQVRAERLDRVGQVVLGVQHGAGVVDQPDGLGQVGVGGADQ